MRTKHISGVIYLVLIRIVMNFGILIIPSASWVSLINDHVGHVTWQLLGTKWACPCCRAPHQRRSSHVLLRWSPSVDVHQLLLMWLECSSLNILLMNQKNFNISHEFLWMSFTNSDTLLYFQFLILFICRTPNQRHLWWKRQVTVDSFFSSSSFLMLPSGEDDLRPSSLSSILFCHTDQGPCDRRGFFGCESGSCRGATFWSDQKLMVVSTYWSTHVDLVLVPEELTCNMQSGGGGEVLVCQWGCV